MSTNLSLPALALGVVVCQLRSIVSTRRGNNILQFYGLCVQELALSLEVCVHHLRTVRVSHFYTMR